MFTELARKMDQYDHGVQQTMDMAWETDGYSDWAATWLNHCGLDPEHIEQAPPGISK